MEEPRSNCFNHLSQSEWEEDAAKSLDYSKLSGSNSFEFEGVELAIWQADVPSTTGIPDRAMASRSEGMPWQIQQTLTTPDEISQGLTQGVEGVRIPHSVCASTDLQKLLDGMYPEMVSIHFDGPESSGTLRSLIRIQRERERALGNEISLSGSCVYDVLRSNLEGEEGQLAFSRHIRAWEAAMPNFRSWGADGYPWTEAGMDAIPLLAWMLVGLDAQWRRSTADGQGEVLPVQRVSLRWSVGTQVMWEAAKLRALRRLWSRWLDFVDLDFCPVWIDAKTSAIRHESWNPEDNMLRNAASTYAAVLGAADGIETVPHDAFEASSPEGKRWARNVQHLLVEESRLHLTFDPLHGSRWAESATRALEEEAWSLFQKWRVNSDFMRGDQRRPNLEAEIQSGRQRRREEGMFRPTDAPSSMKGSSDLNEIRWDALGRPEPWRLVDHLKSGTP